MFCDWKSTAANYSIGFVSMHHTGINLALAFLWHSTRIKCIAGAAAAAGNGAIIFGTSRCSFQFRSAAAIVHMSLSN